MRITMVKISMLYANTPDARFDMDYYLHTHMPMSIERLSAAPGFRGVSVERGVGGGAPDAPPPFVAMCHYLFDSLKTFSRPSPRMPPYCKAIYRITLT